MRVDLLVRLARPAAVLAACFFVFQVAMGPAGRGAAGHVSEYARAASEIRALAREEEAAGRGGALPRINQSVNILCSNKKENRALYEKCAETVRSGAQQGEGGAAKHY